MVSKIALDIGVASVGYAVVDEDYKVLDVGVRLFSSADASQNKTRREKRGTRRLNRRKVHRIKRLENYLKSFDINFSDDVIENPLSLRNRALKEKISIDELGIVLRHLLKHRGISYLEDASEEGGTAYKDALKANALALEDSLPCEVQYKRYINNKCYRGDKVINNTHYSNVFTISAYKKEILAILDEQSKYHSIITEDFVKGYMDIFISKRKYYIGPGSEKSRTPYGRFWYDENGNPTQSENIFEKLIGKCTIYKDKERASGASYTAQEFNLINDLNNLTINNRKLNEKEKIEIVNKIKDSNVVNIGFTNIKKIIKEVIGEEIESISGARVDKKDKEIFHNMVIYKKIRKALSEENINIEDYTREELDKIAHILTINTEKESILSGFERDGIEISDEVKEILIDFRKNNSDLFSKWHSFSLKLMNEIMEDLYKEPKNQMEILTDRQLFKMREDKFKGYKWIPQDIVTEEIFNPVVKRAVRQSIQVLNALIKQYGYPEDIVIEMAREDNNDDAKRKLKEFQKNNENELKNIIKKIKKEYGIEITNEHFSKHGKLKTKLRLWNEQGGKCLYSGKTIEINDLINNFNNFEIDHIIPIAISFDDSRNNKVLVYRSENQLKGNRTPYMYLNSPDCNWNYKEYLDYIKALKLKKKKMSNLSFMGNITKQEVLKGFIARNLNDTRYASRVVLNALQGFVKSKDEGTKIKVINGAITSQLRQKINIKKDREESYRHHGIDAILIAYSQMGLNSYKDWNKYNKIIDFETGEILDKKAFNKMNAKEAYEKKIFWDNIVTMKKEIDEANPKTKFSHKVDKKPNRQLTDETIYGTRINEKGKVCKISRIKNIYDDNEYKKFADKINKGNKELFLMYHNDRKTFDILLKIMNDYSDSKNPFVAYRSECGEGVRKYSKKGNGPFITKLKYYDGEVGSHIDISHKYGLKEGSKKVILDSLKPYRADVYYNKETKQYHIVGIKYTDCKYEKGEYVLNIKSYEKTLKREGVIAKEKTFADLKSLRIKFCFSLYKNDIILYEKDGKEYKERFLSRTKANKNYIETKPIDASKIEKSRNQFSLSKTKKILKINTDILGNEHITTKEKFSLKI